MNIQFIKVIYIKSTNISLKSLNTVFLCKKHFKYKTEPSFDATYLRHSTFKSVLTCKLRLGRNQKNVDMCPYILNITHLVLVFRYVVILPHRYFTRKV